MLISYFFKIDVAGEAVQVWVQIFALLDRFGLHAVDAALVASVLAVTHRYLLKWASFLIAKSLSLI